ncbi:MAG: D-glycero-beta-D-manno-heptose-7-phosphate kinase [Burkholderiales bacterium]|nr:D-glycero-beta-D-manno-heptose-7-phosphate kinase [Burkholderiales bacterium]
MKLLPDLSKARLLVVGDVMLDRYWFGEVSRISPEAPVPVVKVERTEERPGGAANVARNATALGARVTLLSVVGDDEAGVRLRELVEAERVVACLHKDPSIPTTVKLRVIGRQQQLLRVDFETQPSHDVLADKLADFASLLADCDVLVLSDYGKGGLAHIEKMIELARAAGKIILVDPKGDDYTRYHGATIVTPNRAEMREVVGRWKDENDLTRRAQALRQELGAQALLLTRSEEGMSLYQDSGVLHEAAKTREVFDVSGAGDTVIAAVAAMLGSGATLSQAMHAANFAAGIVVGKLGTAVAQRDELQAALKQG